MNGKIQELSRTSVKKIDDLIRCCKLPDVEVCYFDDVEHPKMLTGNVYYLKLKPYYYSYPKHIIKERFHSCPLLKSILTTTSSSSTALMKNSDLFLGYMEKFLTIQGIDERAKSDIEHQVDKIISKRIYTHLSDFFNNLKK